MRNLVLATAAIGALTAAAMPAAAQSVSNPFSGPYGSISYGSVQTDAADLDAVTARVGAKVTPYIGLEAEGSLGVGDEGVTGIPGTTVELKHDLAAYVTGSIPVTSNLELFGRVGYGTTRVRAESVTLSQSDSQDSVNYGAGVNYLFDGQNGVRADWTRRDFRGSNGGEADVWTVGYVRRF